MSPKPPGRRGAAMIVLFTDFGLEGPYTGQVKAVLAGAAPGVPVIDLFADAPSRDPRAAAYLLAAFAPEFPPGTVFLCVVDPGVGSARAALALRADGRWFVGPDNGLLAIAGRRAAALAPWEILWRPERLSASFHGRDLFAPAAAALATGGEPGEGAPAPLTARARGRDECAGADWPDDLAEVVYVDVFGNAMTGLRAATIPAGAGLRAGGRVIARARTFADAPPGAAFWYENANGLAEVAVSGGRADRALGLRIGDAIAVVARL